MRALYLILGALIAVAVSGVVYATHNAPALEDRVATLEAFHGIDYSDPTATDVPPTATEAPPTSTEEPSSFNDAHHGPASHDGLNIHEHGHAPPQWVMDSPWPAEFPGAGEAHQGFKGFYATEKNGRGDESYILGHIISTDAAHNTVCHSYKLWILDTGGGVSYAEGPVCFDSNGDGVTDLVTSEAARPSGGHILSNGDGPCESWYGFAGAFNMDGWTICGRVHRFDGSNAGGDGTFRTLEWIIYPHKLNSSDWLQVSPTLNVPNAGYPNDSLRFRVDSVDFGSAEQPN